MELLSVDICNNNNSKKNLEDSLVGFVDKISSENNENKIIAEHKLVQFDSNETVDSIKTSVSDCFKETKGVTYRCQSCNINFKIANEYKRHCLTREHRKWEKCSVCSILMPRGLFKDHCKTHEDVKIICDVCGEMVLKESMPKHIQVHSSDLPFECQLCPFKGRDFKSFKKHNKTHLSDVRFKCDNCRKVFANQNNLNKHNLQHNTGRPYICHECVRFFFTRKDLEAHFKLLHGSHFKWPCKLCDSVFKARNDLRKHGIVAHNKLKLGRIPEYLLYKF